MSEPVSFTALTPNLGLPLLLAGQAQKEFFVNQALSILDALQCLSVRASLPAPPLIAQEGEAFLVAAPATQAWEGCDNHVALRIGGAWHFIPPREGMLLFDQAAGHLLIFRSGWQRANAPAAPTGGAVIDAEARGAILQLVQGLRAIGLLA